MNKSTCEYLSLESICTKGSSNISINKLNDCNGIYPLYGASGFVKDIDFFHQEKPYIGIVKDGAGVGRVSIYPAKSSLVGTMQYIIPSSKCTINYLYHFLCSLNLSKFVSGATIPHIYFKDYGKCLIPIPTIEEQGMIASELDMITEMISKYDEQLKELDKLSQSIFYEMFGDPVENEKGWEERRIDSTCNVTSSKRILVEDMTNVGIPFLRGTELTLLSNGYEFDEIEYPLNISQKQYDEVKEITGVPEVGDILIPSINSNGYVWIVNTSKQFYFKDGRVIWIHVNKDFFCSEYLRYLLMIQLRGEFENMNGATFAEFKLFVIREMIVMCPPLPLQQSFARKIEAIEAMKSKVKEAKKEAETLLAARMQYWFE